MSKCCQPKSRRTGNTTFHVRMSCRSEPQLCSNRIAGRSESLCSEELLFRWGFELLLFLKAQPQRILQELDPCLRGSEVGLENHFAFVSVWTSMARHSKVTAMSHVSVITAKAARVHKASTQAQIKALHLGRGHLAARGRKVLFQRWPSWSASLK